MDNAPCACGRSFPVISSIEGRSSDFLLAPGNKLIHGESITHVVRNLEGVSAFRVYQRDIGKLIIEIVKMDPAMQLPEERMKQGVQKVFGAPVEVEIKTVPRIEQAASGKYRVVVSDLTGRYFD